MELKELILVGARKAAGRTKKSKEKFRAIEKRGPPKTNGTNESQRSRNPSPRGVCEKGTLGERSHGEEREAKKERRGWDKIGDGKRVFKAQKGGMWWEQKEKGNVELGERAVPNEGRGK